MCRVPATNLAQTDHQDGSERGTRHNCSSFSLFNRLEAWSWVNYSISLIFHFLNYKIGLLDAKCRGHVSHNSIYIKCPKQANRDWLRSRGREEMGNKDECDSSLREIKISLVLNSCIGCTIQKLY